MRLITYGLGLLFALRTHTHLLDKPGNHGEGDAEKGWSAGRALSMPALSAVFVGWMVKCWSAPSKPPRELLE